MVFGVDGHAQSVTLPGNLHSVGLKEETVTLEAFWHSPNDTGIAFSWH